MGQLIKSVDQELLGARLVACPNPFGVERVTGFAPAGATIAEMVGMHAKDKIILPHAHVWVTAVDGSSSDYIPREMWHRVRPKPNSIVSVRVVPQGGGGGGGGGKSPTRIILTIAVMAAAMAAAFFLGPLIAAGLGYATTGAAATAFTIGGQAITYSAMFGAAAAMATSIAGTMLINAVAPISSSQAGIDAPSYSGGTSTDTKLTITGTQNRSNPYGPIPRVYGKFRVFPPYAAAPYTETVGNDQYLRLLFEVGYGPLELSELKIGTTDLNLYEGVEYEIRQGFDTDEPITLYTNTIHEDGYSIRLKKSDGSRTVQTRERIDEISIDISFQGLVTFDASANRKDRTVQIQVEYRKEGDTPWSSQTETITAATEQSYVHNVRIVVPTNGKYEVRLTRLTDDTTNTSIRDVAYLTVVRSIVYTPPAVPKGRCLVAMRIKATGQLNGVVQTFSCVAQSLLRTLDDDLNWTAPIATRNPAWVALDVLAGSANNIALPDARLALADFKEFADYCDEIDERTGEARCMYDACIDSATNVRQMVIDILSTARAALTIRDNKYGVVIDRQQAVPVQVFTPRNSWGFKGTKTFINAPHGIKGKIVNPDLDWTQDEIIAYADGYNETNATLFETFDLAGITRPHQAWIYLRERQAEAVLRPEVYELYADVEHLLCRRGDLVLVQHDVPRWGLGSGRIKSVTRNESDQVTSITTDETFDLEPGVSYAIRFRTSDGTIGILNVASVLVPTATNTLVLETPTVSSIQADDLVVFGVLEHETARLVVKGITRQDDLNAKIQLVDEAPAIFSAGSGTIPPFDRQSTWPNQGVQILPPAPIISEVRSDEEAMVEIPGGWVPAIRVTLQPLASTVSIPIDALEAQYRLSTGGEWEIQTWAGTPVIVYLSGVDEGQYYDLRFRWIGGGSATPGLASDWTAVNNHLVIGKSTPPSDPANLFLSGGNFVWQQPTIDRDFAGWRVRHVSGRLRNWDQGADYPPNGSVVTLPSIPSDAFGPGERTIMVRSVDTSGNLSTGILYLIANTGEPSPSNVIVTYDEKANGWSGTITNGSIVDGNIVANDTGNLYLPDGGSIYLPDPNAIYLEVSYSRLSYQTSFTPEYADTPSTLLLNLSAAGEGYHVEYRKQGSGIYLDRDDAPYLPNGDGLYLGGPDAWAPWPGSTEVGREKVDVLVTIEPGTVRGVLSGMEFIVDVPDIVESFEDLVLSSGGTRIPITKEYRVIDHVGAITIQDTGTGAVSVLVVDRNPVLGPLLRAVNSSGSNCGATIDIRNLKGH